MDMLFFDRKEKAAKHLIIQHILHTWCCVFIELFNLPNIGGIDTERDPKYR